MAFAKNKVTGEVINIEEGFELIGADEILMEQLSLLFERSCGEVTAIELAELSNAMVNIYKAMIYE